MKKTLLFLMAMVLTCVGLQAQVKIQKSTSLPEEGTEYLYLYQMKNDNKAYVGAGSAYGGTNAKLAFYESSTAGRYQIYDCTSKSWWTYTQKSGEKDWWGLGNNIKDPYAAVENFVTTCANKSDAKEFIIENYSGNYYQIKPYYSSGDVPSIYLNYYTGPSNGERLGLYTDGGSKDAGSRWMFELVQQAQAPEAGISSIDNLSNDKLYVLRTKRNGGEVVYNSNYSSAVCWNGHSSSSSISYSKTDARFQWAIYKSEHTGNYYIYSVAGEKFFGKTSVNNAIIPLVSDVTNAVEIKQRSTVANYPFMMSVDGSGIVNASTEYGYGLINWEAGYDNTSDDGSAFAFIEAGNINADMLSNIEHKVAMFEGTAKPIVETGKLYRIKNRFMDLSKSATEKQEDGKGAYLSTTWTQAINFQNGVNAEAVHCATQSMSDAGCVWTLVGDDKNGWKIKNMNNGMFIMSEELISNQYVHFTDAENKAAVFTFERVNENYNKIKTTSFGGTKYLNAANVGLQVTNLDEASGRDWQIIPAEELELTIGAGGYSTMNFAFPVKLAGASDGKVGLMGYVAGEDNGTSIELFDAVVSGFTDGSENVPANTPLIVQGTEGATYTLQILNEEVTNHPNQAYLNYNSLSGTLMPLSFEAGHGKNIYGIATVNGETKFYKMTSGATTIGKNKAYYDTTTSGISKFDIRFGETTTSINDAVNQENVLDKVYYDLNGRRVFYPTRGIYVTGSGKKVFVK